MAQSIERHLQDVTLRLLKTLRAYSEVAHLQRLCPDTRRMTFSSSSPLSNSLHTGFSVQRLIQIYFVHAILSGA